MNIDVSIVIVCMNNLKNLYPCLESIKKYTTVSYETLVVAYLFSKENLEKVKKDFPWITFIESNEIRGFSENNNLALRQAKGKYCFVLNDDTEMKMDVVGGLVKTIESLPENVAIVSPVTTFPDGRVQVCGRPPRTWKHVIMSHLRLVNRSELKKYTNRVGVFKSFNIIGAAFLIKRKLFENVGWFDEYYFFCPEDIALSTTLNKKGYECWVNNDVRIIHYEGMSGNSTSFIKCATQPAGTKGALRFYSGGNSLLREFLRIEFSMMSFLQFVFHYTKYILKKNVKYKILALGDFYSLISMYNNDDPKMTFIKYYKRLK